MRLFEVETGRLGRVATMARPRAGDWLDDEFLELKNLGVQYVVCLLTADEVIELDLGRETGACTAAGLGFVAFPIPDRAVPAHDDETTNFLFGLARLVAEGHFVVVHCRMGIGRSSLVAAAALSLLGFAPDEAFDRLARARGLSVPDTEAQRAWVSRFARLSASEPRDAPASCAASRSPRRPRPPHRGPA